MLDGKKVRQDRYLDNGYFFIVDNNFVSNKLGGININEYPDNAWELYEEPEKVELPDMIGEAHITGDTDRIINQIIRYLKANK